ncbi:MAG TPA: FAD/NAD(P)-binding protein, partial [Acetobacteraceae bacterium]|nr:FAD/NAD(P)-binding protein [Acetobacteraceae bacterium]
MANGISDRDLGMGCPIHRRDFLGGTLIGGAALAAGIRPATAAPQDSASYYPPALHGLRGSHPGSFEMAHMLRDGDFWAAAGKPPGVSETYDLVVVGGGISGLAAAYFHRAENPNARILILENHDDFGGHAKRNEYMFGNRLSLMNGGTLEIDSPYPYSKVADGLLHTLGIDPPTLEKTCTDEDFYQSHGMGQAIFFQREKFGRDYLAVGLNKKPFSELLHDAPLSDRVKLDVARVFAGKGAALPGDDAAKKDHLSRISYGQYLLQGLRVDPATLAVFQQFTHDEWGVGIDAVPALDAWGFGYPGFDDLQLKPGRAPRMGYTGGGYADGGSYKFHFPDGNATIARLLVRAMIPGAIPGHSAIDVVTAHADYAELDRPSNQVRIRLSSIVVGVHNIGDPAHSTGADIVYTRFGTLHHVRAKQCVLACYNMMIPYLCPEMSAAQKDALHYLVKTPLVYTSVAIKNWRAFKKLGVYGMYAPAGYWVSMRLNEVTNIGGYHSIASEDDPVLVFMVRTPCAPGLDERAQNRAGRAELLQTPFETFERHVRDQMARSLGNGGFDPATDITAITANRWPHGYAYEYNSLFDPDWAPGQAPNEIGRKRFGRIAIANSDSGAGAYTSVAIDQAWRAV